MRTFLIPAAAAVLVAVGLSAPARGQALIYTTDPYSRSVLPVVRGVSDPVDMRVIRGSSPTFRLVEPGGTVMYRDLSLERLETVTFRAIPAERVETVTYRVPVERVETVSLRAAPTMWVDSGPQPSSRFRSREVYRKKVVKAW